MIENLTQVEAQIIHSKIIEGKFVEIKTPGIKIKFINLLAINLLIFLSYYYSNCNKSIEKSVGSIKGRFLENGTPCSLRINLHNADNKLFLKSENSGSDGYFSFSGLDFGKYYLITHPADKGTEMPLQWRTSNINISKDAPNYKLSPVDGWSVTIVQPIDYSTFDIGILDNFSSIKFQWTPYYKEALYEIELVDIFRERIFYSGEIEGNEYYFNGYFPDSTQLSEGVYRWTLKVLPKNSEWTGLSNFYDFAIGEECTHKIFESKYIELDFPQWYHRVIKKFDLLTLLDKCYLLTTVLNAGQVPELGPKLGEKQQLYYDKKIMFAHSGQPIHLGKKFIDGKSVPLSTILHEMAHNFQIGGLYGFPQILLDGEMKDKNASFCFSEGLATLNSIYVVEKISDEILNNELKEIIQKEKTRMRANYIKALEYYEVSGNNFNKLTPDVIDGIFYYLGDQYDWDIFPQFFKIFLRNDINDSIYKLINSEESKMLSVIISSLSVSCGTDLREKFREWGFPFDDQFYDQIFQKVRSSLTYQ